VATKKTSAKKKTPAKKKISASEKGSVISETPLLYHRVNGLLHTMRCIAQYEDELCTFLHAARDRKAGDVDHDVELRELLEKMPSHEYVDDLDALKEALAQAER